MKQQPSNNWNDSSLGYIGFGLAGAMLGVFSYGWVGMLVGLVMGLGGAYGLSFIDDDSRKKTWINKLTDWMG